MGAQIDVRLGSPEGPDNDTGADTLYEGFQTVNANIVELKESGAASGALEIGFDNTSAALPNAPTTVQAAIENVTSYNSSGVTTAANIGTGDGLLISTPAKVGDAIQVRNILAGNNVEVEVIGEDIEIRSTASASNTAVVNKIGYAVEVGEYNLSATDEIVLMDTEATGAFTINLTNAANKRIVNIKNLMKSGYSHEVIIIADTSDFVEDDRTGLPGLQTAIGPGSAMRLVYWAADTTWSII